MPASASIEVRLPATGRRYPICIRAGLLKTLGAECRALLPGAGAALLLTDAHVGRLYAAGVADSLRGAGFRVETLTLPAGEASKSLSQAEGVYQALSHHGFSRADAMVALGGGVVGDLAGFCASTWHRGMPVIQVPTSLIAQVDSAMGGKTAVNLPGIKNAVGTFHQPAGVLMDPDALASLPPAEWRAGMAEVFKYSLIETACIGQTGMFEWLDAHADNLSPVREEMIARCATIKAGVIMRDETDILGLRALLNLGHTFGHAYEALSHYAISHGDAVALGTLDAVVFSQQAGLLKDQAAEAIRTLHRRLGLPQQRPGYPPDETLARMRQDKKAKDSRIQLVLPVERPGQARLLDDADEVLLRAVLAR